ncbi:uncharacterized protein EAF01_001035 [Botrytis porri]|uniref:Uncharacterized protein n=1 Tax=Botrytis porri TaxID=87229 RepID=A0A4Z1KMC6_9HELO|nr:uncharacterized protein EAF01_001035 [Botrytis porri]KAF7914629.1 hypothetical protein EAF01_001035 [Botrytis porri]TGO86486.1 hypothetical protein BPOR_0299g00020 [Botrytis porri]
MQLFTVTFSVIFTLLISIVNSTKENLHCLGANKCTLYMTWPAGSPGLESGTMAMPKDLELYGKDCNVIESKMTQAEAKGPIETKSSLPETITLTGKYPVFDMPLFTYGKNEEGGEHCGRGDDDWVCDFPC